MKEKGTEVEGTKGCSEDEKSIQETEDLMGHGLMVRRTRGRDNFGKCTEKGSEV